MCATIPNKKMVQISNLIAECDCGKINKFKKKEINFNKSNDSTIVFNNIYKCTKCNQTYDGILKTMPDKQLMKGNSLRFFIGIILVIGLAYGVYSLFDKIYSPPPTHDLEHATNKELNDFLKWDHEQQQKKWENQKISDN